MAAQPVVLHYGPNPLLLPWLKPTWLPKVVVAPAPEWTGLTQPCLLWLGGKSQDGYGLLRIEGKMQYLHRYSYGKATGQPLGNRDGHHLCYQRPCFQPAHIACATLEENRGPTQFKSKCPVDAAELVALYDLYAYEMQTRGYVQATP